MVPRSAMSCVPGRQEVRTKELFSQMEFKKTSRAILADPRSFAPPSVLPDISPTSGEIGSFAGGALLAVEIGESRREHDLPPKWGRCPAGQRGALSHRR
ncbi:hypothetical protein MES4922_210001 [Mesorhizobium ventifaucium]|uniref:Uncharacterized protein n=1 Tax=Mesorhizobium ventifaucium TaxID=666020 RepID=A0ABN8JSX4_9HYPH|nr:hypothetical protein MES4922_210001 [Mesorhizobium ventifaucium]